ncbi:MAG: hypothetical protein FWC01_06015 [Treponema sp.]|nr:hypothetical protein [Treponema sp.]MCL2237427.1 hypothetical protein [Treponema sp.]
MRCTPWLIFFVFLFISINNVFAQSRDDSAAAQQYYRWIEQAINEDRWDDARAALVRTRGFENVSSDLSYIRAIVYKRFGEMRTDVIEALDTAIQTNRWVFNNEVNALLFKAETLLILRRYRQAIACIDLIEAREGIISTSPIAASAAMVRLDALQSLALGREPVNDPGLALAQFRSQLLITMDRFPRDPRPLIIFFNYARNRRPQPSELPEADINLLELVLRRLPFFMDNDTYLACIAAPFIRNIDDARRMIGSYRAMTTPPNLESIPIALNLGLIDDNTAIEELLFTDDEDITLEIDVITDTYRFLRSEEGRVRFTQRFLVFSGYIISDVDYDGYLESLAHYHNGNLLQFLYSKEQNNETYLNLYEFTNGSPVRGTVQLTGHEKAAGITWERYPSVKEIMFGDPLSNSNERFTFAPADLQYAPVEFLEIGGSDNLRGLLFPMPSHQYMPLTLRTIHSFCTTYTRPSLEIEGAIETIRMSRGVILQSIETTANGRQVSVTEFERGLPVIQHIDLDLDGRMETIRRFRRPEPGYVWRDVFDYRRLIASSESDWSGDGRHKTREVYQLDGSIVYYFDMDGSGTWTHSETGNQR